ncbi:MAG: peptidyl-prolyl cis-trans isomerase [Candidatus Omnitrophica bacterium]|nr:peptidyl-prolyl cis-trans isomerase [Candidatus Omnitrophota bacterium]
MIKFKAQNNPGYQNLSPKARIAPFFFCAFLLFSIFSLCACNLSFAQDKIIAVVNNDIITQKDLDDFINFTRVQLARQYDEQKVEKEIQNIKKDLLDRLIEDRLIMQEAKKSEVKVDESRVKEKIEEIRKKYGSDAELNNSLKRQGLVLADLENKIREQLLMYSIVDSKVRSKVAVNPGEITDFYYKNADEFKVSEEREFDSINLDDENLAKEVCNKLRAGENLMDLSIKYTLKINKLSARKGGELRKDIEDAVFGLKINEVSDPVKSQDSFYVFRLTNIIPPRQESFSEAKDNIYKYILDKKMQEGLVDWLVQLKKKSYIKIM